MNELLLIALNLYKGLLTTLCKLTTSGHPYNSQLISSYIGMETLVFSEIILHSQNCEINAHIHSH